MLLRNTRKIHKEKHRDAPVGKICYFLIVATAAFLFLVRHGLLALNNYSSHWLANETLSLSASGDAAASRLRLCLLVLLSSRTGSTTQV